MFVSIISSSECKCPSNHTNKLRSRDTTSYVIYVYVMSRNDQDELLSLILKMGEW